MLTSKFLPRIGTIAIVFVLTLSSFQPASAVGMNDNFADATVIGSLPFSTNADTYGATFESGEPFPSCADSYYPFDSIWFSYTPSNDTRLTAQSEYWSIPPVLAIYTGSFGNLKELACGYYYPRHTFQAQGGVTYYFQLGGMWGNQGNIPFWLEVTPPPQVSIGFYPWDPSVFDNVNFSANAYDPGEVYGFTYEWALGDGTTSDQQYFDHRFTADGYYTVNLTATTADGRSGSASQVIQVRTHDVAITSFSIPQTARTNQTKTINVDVKNNRYSENVQVTLYKGLPGYGEQQIGVLTIYVPARASRPTTFKFSYTFTPEDAMVGKVTFKAIATILSARDALPSDNTAIGTTKVSK